MPADHDGMYEDRSGAPDFNDSVILFDQVDRIASHGPADAFDFN